MSASRADAQIRYRICSRFPGASYFLATPAAPAGASTLVAVHGLSRMARDQVAAFAPYAATLGLVVIAPVFSDSSFRRFQQLGVDHDPKERADLALLSILDEVKELTGCRTDRVSLFGHSGGGQFAHRFAMAHPSRVSAAAIGAAGWYTFPNPAAPYPRGLARAESTLGVALDPAKFLRIPMITLVGANDVERDRSLRTSERLDAEQGRTRPERARNWVEAMRAAARLHSYDTAYEHCVLPACGHAFDQCVEDGRIDRLALEFLIGSVSHSRIRVANSGQHVRFAV